MGFGRAVRKTFPVSYSLLRRLIHRPVRSYSQTCENVTEFPERIFSGIQPTGPLHLGNYFGAVKKWVELQDSKKDVIFSIVDLHSITLPQDPTFLRKNIRDLTACLLGCGIDPQKSILFLQSMVPQHTSLSWILGCLTTMARLGHLHQFKEKKAMIKEVPLGLFIYPVLQSADILVYKATHVPIGEDQLQHLQLAQHIARVFNNKYGMYFPHPQPILGDQFSNRLKSLRTPNKKMSKSEADVRGRIEFTDSPDLIREKFKKAVTDCTSEVTFDPEKRPGVSNLITIHSLFSGLTSDEICEHSAHLETAEFKTVVADVVIEKLKPIQNQIFKYQSDPLYIEEVLKIGAEKAMCIAEETWTEVKELVGLRLATDMESLARRIM